MNILLEMMRNRITNWYQKVVILTGISVWVGLGALRVLFSLFFYHETLGEFLPTRPFTTT